MSKVITVMVWDGRNKPPLALSADLGHYPDNEHPKRVQSMLLAAASEALGAPCSVTVQLMRPPAAQPMFPGQLFAPGLAAQWQAEYVPIVAQMHQAQAAQANQVDINAFQRMIEQLRNRP